MSNRLFRIFQARLFFGHRRPRAMGTAQSIRKLGFKRWYERQLVQSFAYLIICFAGVIFVAATIEVLGETHTLWEVSLRIGLAAIGGAAVFGAWKLHASSMLLAERLASRASCPTCQTYAAFRVIASGPRSAELDGDEQAAPWLRVRCSRCQCEWLMDAEG